MATNPSAEPIEPVEPIGPVGPIGPTWLHNLQKESHWIARLRADCNFFDALIVLIILLGGYFYHADAGFWSPAQVGQRQYGDAEFWWKGALYLAQGIFADHPGKGYRPGYFILSGFPVALFGWDCGQYHRFLLAGFLAASCWLYLSLRAVVNRLAAACALLAFVFNPFTAEWTATSTTDATGLALNLAMTALLITGMLADFSTWRLSLAALCLALSNLTRPLTAPFVALMTVWLLVFKSGSFIERLRVAAPVVLSFLIPTMVWMGVQRATVGEASLSQNDASALYAASDPNIQCWTPKMYGPVVEQAKARLKKDKPTEADINTEFWRLTVDNYARNARYHLSRILAHVWLVCDFTSKKSDHPQLAVEWAALRTLIALLTAACLFAHNRRRALIGSIILALTLIPGRHLGYFVLCGALLPWFYAARDRRDLALACISSYWLVGVLALFAVGGTWGDHSFSSGGWTPLGYRLQTQVNFASIILAFACAQRLIAPEIQATPMMRNWTAPRAVWSVVCWLPLVCCLIVVLLSELSGAVVVAARACQRITGPYVPFPDIALIPHGEKALSDAGLTPLAKQILTARHLTIEKVFRQPELNGRTGHEVDSDDVLTSGEGTDFVWNLAGQRRSKMLLLQEADLKPCWKGSQSLYVDVPEDTDASYWRWRPGAFVLRKIPTLEPGSTLPYYVDGPLVRAFIPLKKDLSGYDLAFARWYQIQKYACDLKASGDLSVDQSRIVWEAQSGTHPYKRRFRLVPSRAANSASIFISLAHTRGNPELELACESVVRLHAQPVEVVLRSHSKPIAERFLVNLDDNWLEIRAPVSRYGDSVQIEFSNLPPSGGWIYELNLRADDFVYE